MCQPRKMSSSFTCFGVLHQLFNIVYVIGSSGMSSQKIVRTLHAGFCILWVICHNWFSKGGPGCHPFIYILVLFYRLFTIDLIDFLKAVWGVTQENRLHVLVYYSAYLPSFVSEMSLECYPGKWCRILYDAFLLHHFFHRSVVRSVTTGKFIEPFIFALVYFIGYLR